MKNETQKLSGIEKRSITALSAIYGLRMFGLFLILPVLSIYADQLSGATPLLMGVALGIYGITQAMFQIPFGILSDRFGRKKIIILGLVIFAVGSIIAALAETITGVIFGRAMQGAGAIASVVLALTSDLTRENQRTKAMAFVGMTIGLSFLFALIVSPILEVFIGVKGLFFMTAILAVIAILIVWKAVPTPSQSLDLNVRAIPSKMFGLLKNPHLLRFDLGIFILHFILTAMFVVIPIILIEQVQIETRLHWKVYVPALLASIVFMVPMIILSVRESWLMRVFLSAICILLFAQCLLMWRPFGVVGVTVCLFFFFWGFNLLEAMLPSLVSRVAPAATRGSAMGVYNTFQFLGVFCGGLIGGLMYGQVGYNGVFIICSVMLLFWIYLIQSAPELRLLTSRIVKLADNIGSDPQARLSIVDGVEEAIVLEQEQVAYLKVNKKMLDEDSLAILIQE